VLKSVREAKQQTSWLTPDDEFEAAVQRFVTALTTRAGARAVLDEHVRRVGPAGRANSLALLVLRSTLPGFPDTYQGMELWNDSLVDPDNRRPVDFELRRAVLASVAQTMPAWSAEDDLGGVKMAVLRAVLALRRRHPTSFATSAYRALELEGPEPQAAIAFRRGTDVVVVVPRFPLTGANLHRATTLRLPRGSWRNVMTGEAPVSGHASVAALTQQLPVSVLERVR
jgi:(1->4)-alpha-D-glucan 1-alpha-D-glucosylmutase